ncbi:MAG TPA: glycosyltransferase family 87 protein [Candidatus Binataceae bacterium]|nr:glycosyltransferase family 87 protein [Candidatus Binataceae bacterium]
MLCFAALIYALHTVLELRDRSHSWDFSIYYTSALSMREGHDPYTESLVPIGDRLGLKTADLTRAADTPTYLLCFEPLTYLSPGAAYAVWFTLNLIAIIASLWLLADRPTGLDRSSLIALVALAILYRPMDDLLRLTQCQMLIVLMMILMKRWMERGRDSAAGLMLALAALLRVYPIVMAGYLVIERRWRTLGYAILAGAVGAAITLGFVGWPRVLSFVATIVGSHTMFALPAVFQRGAANVAIGPGVSRVFWAIFGVHLSPAMNLARRAIAGAAQMGVLALTIFATLRRRGDDDREWRRFALWVVTMVAISPVAWLHYLVLTLIPFFLIAHAASRGRARPRTVWTMVAAYTAILLAMTLFKMMINRVGPPLIYVVAEGGFATMILSYIAAYLYLRDGDVRPAPPFVVADAADAG